jgi:bacteriocin-like protein
MTTLLTKYAIRLKQADQLIRLKATGTPKSFAAKLNISESHLYNLLEDLRLLGMPLVYNKSQQTYFYSMPVRLKIELTVVPLTDEELKNINGGEKIMLKQIHSTFIRVETSTFVSTISCNIL